MNQPVPLTVTQLFTPASSGIGSSGVVPLTPIADSWYAVELNIAQLVGLPTTAWQPGQPERTILAINAVCLSKDDANISLMAQGSFLTSAATGTVTYQAINGQQVTIPVTPDPSNPAQNSTGALGWLDLLTQGTYQVYRIEAQYAAGQLAVANTGINPANYASGTYHTQNTQTGQTYTNPSAISIPSSIIAAGAGVVADVTPGLTSTIIQTQGAHGLSVGSPVYLVVPASTGVSGLVGSMAPGVFAIVSGVTTNSFSIPISSSGTYAAGSNPGQVYACSFANMQADQLGVIGNASIGAVTQAITQSSGVYISNLSAWAGANWESNANLVARTLNSLAAVSPNGPSQAYEYVAESATQLLSAENPSYSLTNGPVIANEFANPQTGIVTTVVASAAPASTALGQAVTPGCAQNPILSMTPSGATTIIVCANPIGIPGGSGAPFTGIVAGVLGNLSANGTWACTQTGTYSFTIPVTASGTYTGGGNVEAGDLGLIDSLIQQSAVPDGIVGAQTMSALALPCIVLGTVAVPKAYVAQYQISVQQALLSYIASIPLGGVFSPTEQVPVEYDGIIGALTTAGVFTFGQQSVVRQYSGVTLNGGQSDVPFPSNLYQAILSSGTSIAVVGV